MAQFADSVPAGAEFCHYVRRRSATPVRTSATSMTEDELERIAATIEARVIELESEGFRDVALLSLMVEHARDFLRLIHGVTPSRRRELLLKYTGLCKFGFLLARTRARISGTLSTWQ